MSFGRLLLLVIVSAASVVSGVRRSSSSGSQAFITPVRQQTCTDHGECSILPPDHATTPPLSRSKPFKASRVKGVKLSAAAKAGSSKKKSVKKKKKKAAAKKTDVENFKKSEFITSIAEKTGFSKTDSEVALAAVLETITEQLALEKKITLVGFGSFQAKPRAARKGRNPKTGEEIDIAASMAPTFTAAKALKDYVNGRD